ncbi:MAG: hypothetical protein WCY07_05250 [Pigmentiphaga sp.]
MQKNSPTTHWRTLTGLAAACALLTACGGDDSASASGQTRTLSGTAAIGAPIVGGAVEVLCATGPSLSATTDAGGNWQVSLGSHTFPCSARVQNGQPMVTLHSHAPDDGAQVNITPLTDLILAYATGQTPAAWFENRSDVSQAALNDATDRVLAAFAAAGYTVPEGNPFTTVFEIGDVWDQLLDALGESLTAASLSLEDVLAGFADGELSVLPASVDGDLEAPTEAAALLEYAGTYTVTGGVGHQRGTINIDEAGTVDFDTGIVFAASQIVAVYDRRMLDYSAENNIKRLHINYGANDSGPSIQIYLDANGAVEEMQYSNSEGNVYIRVAVSLAAST